MAKIIDFQEKRREKLYGTDESRLRRLPKSEEIVEGYDEDFFELLFSEATEIFCDLLYSGDDGRGEEGGD